MRICFLGWGDHVHLERWANWFAKKGHDISVISVSKSGRYEPGVRCYSLERIGRISIRLQRFAVWILIRAIKPDLLHVHWVHFTGLLDGIWDGPLVVTAWGSDIYRTKPLPDHDTELPKALQRADLITADSADLCARTMELAGLPSARCEIIQWGVDTDLFRPYSRSRSVDVCPDSIARTVLSPRHFTPLYNLDVVVNAFNLAKQRFPDLRLIMKRYAHQADYSTLIENMIANQGLSDSVSIAERVDYDKMPEYYRSGSIVISIPSSDATPMSVLEAMACGCIPIVSDLPSLREWIRDGETGFLVDPDDCDQIADAIGRCLSDNSFRTSAVRKNRELVESRASQNVHMGIMEEHYKRLTRH